MKEKRVEGVSDFVELRGVSWTLTIDGPFQSMDQTSGAGPRNSEGGIPMLSGSADFRK